MSGRLSFLLFLIPFPLKHLDVQYIGAAWIKFIVLIIIIIAAFFLNCLQKLSAWNT